MSELVLPKASENPTLNANLDAFFKRYPHERSRLEFVLSQPVPPSPVNNIMLPTPPERPYLRIVLLAGIGSPLFLNTYFNDPKIQDDTFMTFIIENNVDFLRLCFQHFNLTSIINYQKTEWCLLMNEETIKPALFRVLKREHIAAMMTNVHILETDLPQPDEVKAFYKKLPRTYDETVHHIYHNFGRIDDSLDGVKATLMNASTILSAPGITELRGVFKGMPALIVGAGPSLDKELDIIKKNNNKFVVIAADAALKPLIQHGIRVDYVTSIERLNDYQKPFFEGLESITTELVAFPVIQPEQFTIYPGPVRLCYRNYSYFAYFEKSWPKGIIKCGGSTSHLAMRLADWMGCSRAYLVGIDSCYEQKSGTAQYRSHCSNTGYKEWGEFVELSEFGAKRKHLPPIESVNNLGEKVMTNMTYYQWIKEYGEELAEIGQRMTITNCSPIGLRMEGIPFKTLSEVSSQFDEVAIEKPVNRTPSYYRTFTHKELIKNIKGWVKVSEDSIKECDELTKLETVPDERWEALMFVFNFRIAIDALFVAFVVQCCAKEFFEFENKWWALNKDWGADRHEKVKITKARLELFREVLNKLLVIFKETGHD